MPRAGIDRARVIHEAAALADAEGLTALSMAALAKRLGIALPSLYTHVKSLEHVRQQIAALASRDMAQQLGMAVQGRAQAEALAAFAAAYRAYVLAHSGRYAASHLMFSEIDDEHRASALQIGQIIAATLHGYGIDEAEQTNAVRMLRSALHGFASLEHEGHFHHPQSLDESFARMVQALDASFRSWPGAKGEKGKAKKSKRERP